jgi:twinkle protein
MMRENFNKIASGELQYSGFSTGFESLDELMMPAPGYLMVLTGYPGSGKSEWLDALLTNLSVMHGWKTLYFSPENFPIDLHMSKLATRFCNKPTTECNHVELDIAYNWLEDHFQWMYPPEPDLTTLLEIAQNRIDTTGLDVLVLDPWNNIMHKRSGDLLHEYLSNALTRVIKFARTNKIFLVIVAHPKGMMKTKDGKSPSLTLADISDGPMWWNKADYGVVVARPDKSKHYIEVQVQKIKQKWMGTFGTVDLPYEYYTGRFRDKDAKDFALPHEFRSPF